MQKNRLVICCVTILCVTVGLLMFDGVKAYLNESPTLADTNIPLPGSKASDVSETTASNSSPVVDTAQHIQRTYVDPSIPIQPILPIENIDRAKAKIGWRLFKDPNLSSNKQVSCESCHHLQTNGAEQIPVSVGVNGVGLRNSLTVFNAMNNYRFFWDGRVNSLEEQLEGPIHNPVEMDSSWEDIHQYVASSELYRQLFSEANLNITVHTIKSALVEFENALTTLDAPFDLYLYGQEDAISDSAKRGWSAFKSEGCIACHQGTNVGGGLVMRFGYFGQDKTGSERSSDLGRFATTSKPEDRHLFRVASLRNVADTAPYFHDGQTQHLSEAIRIMGKSQLGKDLDDKTVDDIQQFLITLSGKRPSILEEFENE
ncbi:cytochrome-c peroxidase [Vibrio agarivorans]|uniref:cytochrome-c peroxidase n=1 Tax=Vibrio agarivorans TaxID=153622 RepID=UPI00222F52A2|nr:cytochrome c peroxidase [Vibrio agarivorans]